MKPSFFDFIMTFTPLTLSLQIKTFYNIFTTINNLYKVLFFRVKGLERTLRGLIQTLQKGFVYYLNI